MKRSVPSVQHVNRSDRPTESPALFRTHRGFLSLVLLALVLKSVIFAPIGWWPVAFFCLVPWLVLIGGAKQAPRVYLYSYLFGLAFFLLNMRWLHPATGLGYVALSVYQAAYFPLVACPVRHAVRRRRLPLSIVVPVVWTGSEMLRAVVVSGFPWFFLSHALYKVLPLIQVSDLVGAYGVSFVIASMNGAIADVLIARWAPRQGVALGIGRRQARRSVVIATSLLAGTCVYGWIQLHRGTTSPGPKIAVIQTDYLNTVYGEEVEDSEKMRTCLAMMGEAAKQHPDLYLLPETPWRMYLNPSSRGFYPLSRQSFRVFTDFATQHDAYLVTGSGSLERTPNDLRSPERRYNSAMVFHPDGTEPDRYDKVHLVYFGEIVPFRFGRLRPLYFWLNSLVPFSGPDGTYEYSLFPGTEFRTFSMEPPSETGRVFRFGIPICYEDVMPYVSREFVKGGASKRADFLLNISNDGWFGRNNQQPQHLAICVFRAVENRVGIARSVNTGISGFIEPSGRMHDLLTGARETEWPGATDYAVANVGVDSRYTIYSRYGDWFAWLCALIWLVIYVDYWIARARGGGPSGERA